MLTNMYLIRFFFSFRLHMQAMLLPTTPVMTLSAPASLAQLREKPATATKHRSKSGIPVCREWTLPQNMLTSMRTKW